MAGPSSCARERVCFRWGSVCHHVELGVSRFIPSIRFRRGFTVGQVVYDYGDLCQAITDVAIEQNAASSAAEFRTLNRCLDNAIADAVTEFGHQREERMSDEHIRSTNERLGILAHELRNLVHRALLAVAAIKEG